MSSIYTNVETGSREPEIRTDPDGIPRLLLIAFCCDPDFTMEDRNGWHRAIFAAQKYEVTVLVSPMTQTARLQEAVPEPLKDRIRFVSVPLSAFHNKCLNSEVFFYAGYRAWMRQCLHVAQRLHSEQTFALTHMVSLCGYREPGEFWRLGCPSIVGPIGGTSSFPIRFLSIAGITGSFFEVCRNVLNCLQLRYSSRIRTNLRKSALVLAANMSSQKDLMAACTLSNVPVDLETGLDYEPDACKVIQKSQGPFRLLWAGRLRAWKGLPLLLHAIAQLPEGVEVSLRVMGDGKCKRKWQKLARRLKIADRIEWLERPHYRDSMDQYRWADAFAFTSLRDTSGSGLLEALAAGTPIIGMNHQGAADIMTDDCSLKISVQSPRRSIAEFRNAIVQLHSDKSLLARLSEGALIRAAEYVWSKRHAAMANHYSSLNNQIAFSPNGSRLNYTVGE